MFSSPIQEHGVPRRVLSRHQRLDRARRSGANPSGFKQAVRLKKRQNKTITSTRAPEYGYRCVKRVVAGAILGSGYLGNNNFETNLPNENCAFNGALAVDCYGTAAKPGSVLDG
jgi:hypothetical protein